MTVEKYRPNKLDDAMWRLSEECSEVQKVLAKAGRFGLNDTHPVKGKKNIDLRWKRWIKHQSSGLMKR